MFRQGAISPPNTRANTRRDHLLEEYGKAVATRPLDMDVIKAACNDIREELGEGALVEAAATIAGCEVASRIVDATGKAIWPPLLQSFVTLLYSIVLWIKWLVGR